MRQMRRPGDIRIETQRLTTARGMRDPRVDFQGAAMKRATLTGVALLPVLAGDTVAQANYAARVIGANEAEDQVVGSWFESWLFYVRVGDMPDAETIRELLVDPTAATNIDWWSQVQQAVWKGYFMDEDEVHASTFPRLRWPVEDWADSAVLESTLPPDTTPGGGDDWTEQWTRFEAMRRSRLTVKTFEEYLAAQGVAVPPQLRNELDTDFKVPELLHYSREFAYPQPTINPTTGTGASRVQWFLQEKMAKQRFCAEPGFIALFVAIRPKPYLKYLVNPLDFLDTAEGWLPIDFDTDPHTSLLEVPTGIMASDTVSTVVDIRDYWLNGYSTLSGADSLNSNVFNGSFGHRPTQTQIDAMPTFRFDMNFRMSVKGRISKDTTK